MYPFKCQNYASLGTPVLELQLEFIRTQHLHVVAWSRNKLLAL